MAFINAVCAEGNHNQSHVFPPQAFQRWPIWPPTPCNDGKSAWADTGAPSLPALFKNSFVIPLPIPSRSCSDHSPHPLALHGQRVSVMICLKHNTFLPSWWCWIIYLLEHCKQPLTATARLPLVTGQHVQHVQGSTAARPLLPWVWFLPAHR